MSTDDLVADVLAMKQGLIDDKFFGPFALYVPTAYDTVLDEDYSTLKGSNTIRERLMGIEGIESIKVADHLTANTVVLVQLDSDVVRIIEGLPMTNVEWQTNGNMIFHFKVMTISVPQIRSDQDGNTGLAVLS